MVRRVQRQQNRAHHHRGCGRQRIRHPDGWQRRLRPGGGADGTLWFTESNSNKIGRITALGVITETAIPTTNSAPWAIAAGPDGALWFAAYDANQIGRLSPPITEFTIPTASSGPAGIAAGPDGALWFTELFGGQIGRITTAGSISETPVLSGNDAPNGIVEDRTARCGSLSYSAARSDASPPRVSSPNSQFPLPTVRPRASRPGRTARCGSLSKPICKSHLQCPPRSDASPLRVS